jgi:hypothetical protein
MLALQPEYPDFGDIGAAEGESELKRSLLMRRRA